MAIKLKAQAIMPRRDTTANWRQHPMYIPQEGEVIIYTDHKTITDNLGNTITIPGIKIGDGKAYGIDLPFVTDGAASDVMARLIQHEENAEVHVTPEERVFWNNKVRVREEEENLIFYTN